MKAIELTLPAFAFLDGNSPQGNTLEYRKVVLHVRSASVLEFFHDEVLLKENVISKQFIIALKYGVENITCAIHHSPLIEDKETIIQEVLNPAILWYKNYLQWEDENMVRVIQSNNIARKN